MSRSRTTSGAALAGLALCLGACSPAPSSVDEATASPSTSPPTTQSTSSDYLPVPDGVELTDPGSELEVKDDATVAWRPRQDVEGVLGLSIVRIEKTSVAKALKGFQLSDQVRDSTPYFVRAVVSNDGESDLGGRVVPLYAIDSSGRLIEPTGVDNGFEPCPDGALPAIFAPGDTTRSCLIFLVPSGAALESVMFRPPEGVVPLTWTGPIEQYGKKRQKKKSDRAPGG